MTCSAVIKGLLWSEKFKIIKIYPIIVQTNKIGAFARIASNCVTLDWKEGLEEVLFHILFGCAVSTNEQGK